MAFDKYASINRVIDRYRVRYLSGAILSPAADAPPFNDYFLDELKFNLREISFDCSEFGSSELVMFPILREVWKTYHPDVSLFSHEPLEFDADLTGTPDYFVCKRSEFGPFYPTTPYLLVVEAKLDDFHKAWGQCLAAMLAAQKLNATPDKPVYGIATNGRSWEFGVLLDNEFTRDPNPIAIHNLDSLREMLHAFLRACWNLARAATSTTIKP